MPSHISTAYEIRPAQPRGKCQKSQEVVDQSCRPFERSRAITPYGMSPHKAQGRVSTCTLPRNKPTKYDFNVAFDEAEAKAVSPSPELARASVPVRLFSRRPGLLSAALQVERSLELRARRVAASVGDRSMAPFLVKPLRLRFAFYL